MDALYWERVGDDYQRAIFDSAGNDRSGVIRERLEAYADPAAVACDFGCGIGQHLPGLAPLFRRVYGVDFAESLLRQAAARCSGLENVTLLQADLSRPRLRLPLPKVGLALCANVLIGDDATMRRRILQTLHRHLARGAHGLFLLPSLESALFCNQRLVEWNRRLGFGPDDALESGIPPTRKSARELLQGLIRIERVPTKHYLREEAFVLLEAAGFRVVSVERVEYGWDTEFEKPPRWMGRPGPWDWLLVARKRSPVRR
jgi:SAM-dependent methyltransferase